ncbi:hypothetical protein ABFS83_04G172200 [Erythranthe nasuta]
MAYGAVGSLKLTIERLLNSSHISIVQNSSPPIIELLYEEVCSFQDALEEFDEWRSTINMKMVKTLEAEIIDVVYKFEDVIESHVLDQIQSQSEESHHEDQIHPPLFAIDLQDQKQNVDSFIETVKEMKTAYIHELHNPSPEEEQEEDDRVGPSSFGGNHDSVIGQSKDFIEFLRDLFTINYRGCSRTIVSIYGMAGIGKTIVARKFFRDPLIVSHYNRRAFVTIGPKYLLKNVLLDILRQVDPDFEITNMDGEMLAELKRMVCESLKDQRYFIVLDDIWDKELCSDLMELFPDDDNQSLVLMTTRLGEVADIAPANFQYKIPFLDKKESWDLLRQKVFGEMPCPPQLEKAGKKIAENCEGLPLTIVTVADILSKSDKTTEYWNKVSDVKDSVYKDAYDQMSKVLLPSYDYLNQYLKACFLYMGVYPQHHKIPWAELSFLWSLWSAEGFLYSAAQFRERIPHSDMVKMFAEPCTYYMFELVLKNVFISDIEVSCCSLHSSLWYMCNKEATKNKFFYALNCRADALPEEGIESQRRLCIRNNVLLAIEDVRDSIASTSTVRSLLCTGPYHHYPLPLCLEHLRFLRVFHACTIRFYEFPIEILKLVQLRYLSLTYNGNIPSVISKLWNLQWLIIRRQLIVENNSSYMPREIWDMKELRKLDIAGCKLSDPRERSFLPNLLELYNVDPQSCTKDVFERIPNLATLNIVIKLAHGNVDQPLSCFDHVSHLHELKSLACDVMNPTFKAEVVAPLARLSDFPSSLTKLTLSGLGFPWEEMRKISSLPNLTNLYLKCYAFRGPKWEVRDNEFQRLKSLEIEDIDLERWTFQNDHECIPAIKVLRIAHCYKLKEIPHAFATSILAISIVDCNPTVVNCVNKLRRDSDDKYGDGNSLFVLAHSSWDDPGTSSHESPY